MRSPVLWFIAWVALSNAAVFWGPLWSNYLVAAFWLGWGMAIVGCDISDWLEKRP